MEKQQTSTEETAEKKPTTKKEKPKLRLAEEVDKLRLQLEAANKKAEDNWDKALRACAELENVKKRLSRDVENAHKFALEKFLNQMLPAIDSMEKAMEVDTATDVKSMQEGVELTYKMLVESANKFGLEQVDALDKKFNPEFHEAMVQQPGSGKESGIVLQVIQNGYLLNGRLVRPARVIVSQ